jgi:uncharacterized protein (TIGR00645 family)
MTAKTQATAPEKPGHFFGRLLASIIFSSRWLQMPLYLGLILVQVVYVYKFLMELKHLLFVAHTISETEIMLIALALIDLVMISNLIIMVIIGGYETFVSRLRMNDHPDSPEWLSHVNANTMKIKLSLALIGISSIHLLKSFINADHLTDRVLAWQCAIHIIFLFSAVFLAYTSKLAQEVVHPN